MDVAVEVERVVGSTDAPTLGELRAMKRASAPFQYSA